jgi:hypothetical protein
MNSLTRKAIDEISRNCEVCKRFDPAPRRVRRRVRSAIPSENIQFNIKVSLDIFYVDASPVLHVICRGTRFSATSFLTVKSSAEVWYTFLAIWVYAYLGPPHELLVDQGTKVT